MKANPVCWFEIYVQDMARARAFYQSVLGTSLTALANPDCEMWTFPMSMEAYGAAGALVRMEGCASGGSGTMVYFSCEDCATEAGRVAAAGGRVFREKFSIGEHGHIALAVDTEGNMFGLHSMR